MEIITRHSEKSRLLHKIAKRTPDNVSIRCENINESFRFVARETQRLNLVMNVSGLFGNHVGEERLVFSAAV